MRPDIDVRVLGDKKKPSAPRIFSEGRRASSFFRGLQIPWFDRLGHFLTADFKSAGTPGGRLSDYAWYGPVIGAFMGIFQRKTSFYFKNCS